MKICIVGSYKWLDGDIPKAQDCILGILNGYTDIVDDVTIISGECPKGGVDIWTSELSRSMGLKFQGYPPKVNRPWAYMERNRLMARDCDVLYRIVSKVSTTYGSGVTADYARKLGREVREYVI